MKWTRLEVRPLANVESTDDVGVWRALNEDPQFELGDPPQSGGWFLLDLTLSGVAAELASPCLYPDYGAGLSESERIPLPLPGIDGRISTVIRLKYPPRAIRLDPTAAAVDHRVGECRIAQLSRSGAFLRMIRSIATIAGGDAARLVVDAARGLIGGEATRVGELIYSAYVERKTIGPSGYQQWIEKFDHPLDPAVARERVAAIAQLPLFSVVMPVYNTPEEVLVAAVESVRRQSYPHWELCIANDASRSRHIRPLLDRYAAQDSRIRIVHRTKNGHISQSSNSALAIASGSHVALLDHDDELHQDALLHMAEAIQSFPDAALLYSDEDKIDSRGRRFDPYFKPSFDAELILGQNFICHLGVYRRDLVSSVGGFRQGYEGSQDWDLALRVIDAAGARPVVHVPRVLYHWRAIEGSTALGVAEKSYAALAGQRAVEDALRRRAIEGSVRLNDAGHVRVHRSTPKDLPLVSIVVPTRDKVELLRVCVESILRDTAYSRYEVLIVDNGSIEPATLEYFEALRNEPRVRIVPYPKPFNYSAINNFAVGHSNGQVVCLMNNDIEVIAAGWLDAMVSHAVGVDVGAVGAMLYYPNDTIQHAGVLIGAGGVGGHAFCGERRGSLGYMGRLGLPHSPLAVTAACLLVRRTVWDEMGGLDEGLKVAFNDVDFCLRVAKAGYRNIWTPDAELYHHESASRGYEDTPERQARFKSEVDFMLERWGSSLERDPAYNPNLTLSAAPFTLAFPPRSLQARVRRFV